jgi:hypothetical protein
LLLPLLVLRVGIEGGRLKGQGHRWRRRFVSDVASPCSSSAAAAADPAPAAAAVTKDEGDTRRNDTTGSGPATNVRYLPNTAVVGVAKEPFSPAVDSMAVRNFQSRRYLSP